MIKRAVSFLFLFALLFSAWLLWSGHWTWDALFHGKHTNLVGFAVLSCLAVMGLVFRMDRVAGDKDPYYLGIRPLIYFPWLLWEIVKANLHVTRVVLSPRMPISPRLLRVKVSQTTELGKVIYANSITLTPGTITLDVRGDHFLVHALTTETADGVLSGEMDRKVRDLEGDVP